MADATLTSNERPPPSDERNGCFLDKMWCCKVCDGEIPDGHTEYCDIWKLEKKHRDFLANEYNAVLVERDQLKAALAERGSIETVAVATLRTMTTAIGEAQDLLECAQPAEHLEATTPDDWYAEREAWMKRNTLSDSHSEKAVEQPSPVDDAEFGTARMAGGEPGERARMTNIQVKCVICSHRFEVPLTPAEPMCPKCYGPVVPIKVATKANEMGK